MTDHLVQHTTQTAPQPYRALILTIGKQGDQVVFCIQQHRPEYVALLGTNTPQCRTAMDEVQNRVGIPASRLRTYNQFPDDPQSIGEVIRAFYEAYQWLTRQHQIPPTQIAVDPTGGRKWMSAGLTMIASALDLPIIYVHKENDAAPMSIVSVGNAFRQLGFLEEMNADAAFNKGHYQTAAMTYQKLATTMPDPVQVQRNTTKKHLAVAYDAWSKFRFADASHNMQSVVDQVARFQRALQQLVPHRPILDQQRSILDVLRRNDENRNQYVQLLRDDPAFIQHILLTMEAQHRRDAADGRFEHAVILVYRILELLSQWRLALRHIDTENIPENIRTQYEQPFRELSARVYRERGGRAVPTRAALTDGWLLLYCMGDDLVRPEIAAGDPVHFFSQMIGQLTARNLLWIEHRNNLMDGNRYQTFAQFVQTFINRFFPENQFPRAPYQFITLQPLHI